MNPQTAHDLVLKTLRILSPEILLLATAMAMMTLAPFLRWPRRTWFLIAAGALAASFLVLLIVSGVETDLFAAVALNDALAFYGRIVVLLSGLVLLALAHEEPGDDRAGEFFGALLDHRRRGHAGHDRQRARLPLRRSRAGQHADVPAALPQPTDDSPPRNPQPSTST